MRASPPHNSCTDPSDDTFVWGVHSQFAGKVLYGSCVDKGGVDKCSDLMGGVTATKCFDNVKSCRMAQQAVTDSKIALGSSDSQGNSLRYSPICGDRKPTIFSRSLTATHLVQHPITARVDPSTQIARPLTATHLASNSPPHSHLADDCVVLPSGRSCNIIRST